MFRAERESNPLHIIIILKKEQGTLYKEYFTFAKRTGAFGVKRNTRIDLVLVGSSY